MAGASGALVCTSTRPPRGAAPGAARELRDQRERALLGAEVGEAQRRVGVEHDAERDVGEVVALGDHLRAEQQPLGRARGSGRAARARRPWSPPCRRRAGTPARRAPRAARARSAPCRRRGGRRTASRRRRSAPAPARGGRSGGTRSRSRARCSTSATSHCGHSHVFPHVRQVRKFDHPRRLSSTIDLRADASARRVSGCSGWRAPRMSSTRTGGSGRESTRVGQRQARQRVPRLRARRGRADQQPRAGAARRARRPTVARVVAGVALVLVGGVVLLVDDDQPEVRDRGEDGGARADGDPRLARAQPPPLVVALALPQRGVQQRDGVAEARLEAADGLRRERDLGHEHDHALAALERRGGGAQVDLGLARAGDAVQQVRPARLDGRRARPPGRASAPPRGCGRGPCAARGGAGAAPISHQPARLEPPQRGRARRPAGAGSRSSSARWLLGQPLARRAARRRDAPTARVRGLPARRQHERQRPRGRRAVLLGHPQRERDEVGRARRPRARRSAPPAAPAPARSASAIPTTTPSSFWRPNGTRTIEPTSTGASGQRVVERAATGGGWW